MPTTTKFTLSLIPVRCVWCPRSNDRRLPSRRYWLAVTKKTQEGPPVRQSCRPYDSRSALSNGASTGTTHLGLDLRVSPTLKRFACVRVAEGGGLLMSPFVATSVWLRHASGSGYMSGTATGGRSVSLATCGDEKASYSIVMEQRLSAARFTSFTTLKMTSALPLVSPARK